MENNILKVNQITVEDTEHYTVLKLLHKLIGKINELVYANGDIYDKLDYLLKDGLSEEVVKALTDWLNDGTLSDIITEEVLADIDSRLDTLEEIQTETNAQLLQKSNQDEVYPYILDKIRVNTSNRLYSQPVVTFIDDDGTTNFLTITKPLFDEYGIIGSIAVIPSKVGTQSYMSEEQLMELQKQGYSMLSHSYTHDENIFKPSVADSNGVSDTAILNDYKQCYDWMVERGFNGADTIVYPWGGFTDSGRYKNLARTYYNNGINASGDECNEDLNDNMYLNRKFINKNVPLSTYQAIIDDTIEKGGWLILGSHSNYNEIDQTHLRQIIEYIREKNIAILPFIEANELKGNAINIGDYTIDSKFFVSRRGTTSLTYDKTTTIDSCVGESGYNASSSINVNNNVVNVILTLTSSSNNGAFTNQMRLATITSIPKLPMTTIIPCVVTTADSKVYVTGCVLNASTSSISISCHGTLENVTNIKRIDINATYVTK